VVTVTMPTMKITADRDVCIGAGMCVMNAPEVFDQDDDGVVVVLTSASSGVPEEHEAAAARAVASCPSGALRRVGEVQVGEVQVEN
jgi:ferredoxin